MTNETLLLIAGVVVLVLLVLGIAVYMAARKRRSRQLAEHYGPEYERTVAQMGKRGKAEKELQEREKRVRSYEIRPLPEADQERFAEAWRRAQARFVDSPVAAVADADSLVREVMRLRGYPVADFEHQAADLSVDHPVVVENYRAGRELAEKSHRGQASTEDLRQAMVHYRTLFEELVGVREPELAAY